MAPCRFAIIVATVHTRLSTYYILHCTAATPRVLTLLTTILYTLPASDPLPPSLSLISGCREKPLRQLRHRQRCYTYLLPLYTSLTVKSSLLARTYSRLSTHIHTQTRRSPPACPASPVLLVLGGKVRCPCVCVAVVAHARPGSTRTDTLTEAGKAETARLPSGHGRDESRSTLPCLLPKLSWRVSSRELFPVPLAACSGYTHHASPRRAVRPRVTSDNRDIGE